MEAPISFTEISRRPLLSGRDIGVANGRGGVQEARASPNQNTTNDKKITTT